MRCWGLRETQIRMTSAPLSAFSRCSITPDHNPDNTEGADARFKELNEAYEVLGDANKRWQYDCLISLKAEPREVYFAENANAREGDLMELLRKLETLGVAGRSGCGWPKGRGCRKGWCRRG